MSRMKSIFAVLLLTAVVCIVPQAQATVTVEVTIAGSSAMWQSLALGAYKLAGAGAGHWTSASNTVNLTDGRVSPVNVDPGTIWIVWNSTGTKVWAFDKVDSVVGNRCYFAQPHCGVSALASNLAGSGANQISKTLFPDGSVDTALPAAIVQLFATGTPVTVAATDIRPEDAAFAICRVNSTLGASAAGGSASDGLDGLGYNSNNASGVCPANGLGYSSYQGSPILSAYPGGTNDTANVLSFNISGSDPINGTTIPAYTVVEVGADPIVFVNSRSNTLANLVNATPQQLAKVFSGKNCDASEFDGPDGDPLTTGGINIFLREPLSGTMNTTEATVFRRPTVYTNPSQAALSVLGLSQESNVGSNNPLAGQTGTCLNGAGSRYRAIGTGEEVNSVLNSNSKFTTKQDGIGYTFFSYGNVKAIASNPLYGYITLNGVDPIFASYGPQLSTGVGFDPGQPATAANPGMLPGAANLPAACGTAGSYPCAENVIWKGGLSFPNVRNGSYSAWSILRLVSNGTGLTNSNALVKASQQYVVTTTPDYVPFTKTVAGGITDPGLLILRSHYQQKDGAIPADLLGGAPVNHGTTEAGGDMGGQILPCATTTTCSSTTQNVQGPQGFQVRP